MKKFLLTAVFGFGLVMNAMAQVNFDNVRNMIVKDNELMSKITDVRIILPTKGNEYNSNDICISFKLDGRVCELSCDNITKMIVTRRSSCKELVKILSKYLKQPGRDPNDDTGRINDINRILEMPISYGQGHVYHAGYFIVKEYEGKFSELIKRDLGIDYWVGISVILNGIASEDFFGIGSTIAFEIVNEYLKKSKEINGLQEYLRLNDAEWQGFLNKTALIDKNGNRLSVRDYFYK